METTQRRGGDVGGFPDGGIAPIRGETFRRFQDLVRRESGICLSDAKRTLLVGRLSRRLRELALTSFDQYLQQVERDEEERVWMLDSISTNETQFFREPRQFEFLSAHVFPRWAADGIDEKRPRRVTAWSAGCSSGEEPYSLAMLLLSGFPKGWDLGILATDLSTRVLERGRAAVWPLERSRQIPPRFLKAFMLRGTGPQDGKMKAGPEIRALIRFERLNLNDEIPRIGGPFDLILCRNVLIYFDAETRRRILRELLGRLDPGGFLLVGHAESLSAFGDGVRQVAPSIYAAQAVPGRTGGP